MARWSLLRLDKLMGGTMSGEAAVASGEPTADELAAWPDSDTPFADDPVRAEAETEAAEEPATAEEAPAPTVALKVTREERFAPAVMAASASAQANLANCLLRPGRVLDHAVDCVDIYFPEQGIITIPAGGTVPEGNPLIPANLVHLDQVGLE